MVKKAAAKATVKPAKKAPMPQPKAKASAKASATDDSGKTEKSKKAKVPHPAIKSVTSTDHKTSKIDGKKDKPAKKAKTEAAETPAVTWAVGDKGTIISDGESSRFKIVKHSKKGWKIEYGNGDKDILTDADLAKAHKKGAPAAAAEAAPEPKKTAAPTKADSDVKPVTAAENKRAQKVVADLLRETFGFVDSGESFYVAPPESATALTLFVLNSHEDALSAMSKVDAETFILSGETIAVRAHLSEKTEKTLRFGHAKGAIRLLHQTTFDPRGMNPATWETAELVDFVVAEQIVSAKKAKTLKRDELLAKVNEFGQGGGDGGATAADETDVHGEALAKAFDRIIANKATRGQAAERKELIKVLTPYREELFERGRKTRIAQIKKLAKDLTDLSDKDREKIMTIVADAADSLK